MLETGALLQNRYRIQRRIGGGGMGTVYLADDTRLAGRVCAVKEMSPAQVAPTERNWAIQAFRQEAQLLANLSHPGLTNVTDFFPEGGNWYLIMEYIQGETLEARLARAPGGRLELPEALRITQQLCEVLDYLHRQQPPVVFRDLKPGNVMLNEKGQVKLIDFGIARFFKSGRVQDTVNLGTPGYAAPEQYGGMGQTDARSDIYSLGVLLHQMVTGYNPANAVTPFPLPDPRSLTATLPPHVVSAVRSAVQMQPDLRYASVREFARDLALRVAGGGGAPVPVAPGPTPAPARHSGIWIGLALGLVIALLAVGGGWWGLQALRERRDLGPTSTSRTTVAAPTHTPRAQATRTETKPATFTPERATDTPMPTPTPDRAARERDLLRTLFYRAENGTPVFAYRAMRPPVLDGRLDEWEGERYWVPYLVYTAREGEWTGTADLSGAFYASWDESTLYLGVDVIDDQHVQIESGPKLYLGDSLEIQVDTNLAGDYSANVLSDDDLQIGFSPGDWGARRPEATIWQPSALESSGGMIRVAAQPTPRGYTLEAAIPWGILGGRPALEVALGFCLNLSDNDTPGTAAQQAMLSSSAARKLTDPTTWGTLVLMRGE